VVSQNTTQPVPTLKSSGKKDHLDKPVAGPRKGELVIATEARRIGERRSSSIVAWEHVTGKTESRRKRRKKGEIPLPCQTSAGEGSLRITQRVHGPEKKPLSGTSGGVHVAGGIEDFMEEKGKKKRLHRDHQTRSFN